MRRDVGSGGGGSSSSELPLGSFFRQGGVMGICPLDLVLHTYDAKAVAGSSSSPIQGEDVMYGTQHGKNRDHVRFSAFFVEFPRECSVRADTILRIG